MRSALLCGLVLATLSAGVALATSPPAHRGVVIDDRVYAECTRKVWREMGTPPGQAAHFVDNWVWLAHDCALKNSRMNYRIKG